MKKESFIASKSFVVYAKKDLVLMMTIKNIKKLDIIVIPHLNIEELLMIFGI